MGQFDERWWYENWHKILLFMFVVTSLVHWSDSENLQLIVTVIYATWGTFYRVLPAARETGEPVEQCLYVGFEIAALVGCFYSAVFATYLIHCIVIMIQSLIESLSENSPQPQVLKSVG